jgi:CubicO group peptidase (beta-lactamase class C family)
VNRKRASGISGALPNATGNQEQRFAKAFRVLDEAVAGHVFPGASLAVTYCGELVAWRGFGRFTYDAASPRVTPETVWDLASLTKPLATTAMAMLLYERGSLRLDAPVVERLPEFAHGDMLQRGWREVVTARMLLAHSAGLPAHRKLYLAAIGRKAMLTAAMRVPLETAPMERTEYSDIGFMVLGELLERIAGEELDDFCRREVFEPINLNFHFIRQPERIMEVPPTMIDTVYRARTIQGEVNDENASAMGGVAGQAGLFGDARSVACFAECLLRGGAPLFRPETVRLFTTRRNEPAGTSRTLGWDTPTPPSQAGEHFSQHSFGHLGYTGTSLWCDPDRRLSVTLVTNRTWPDASNQAIKQLRPAVHDAIVSSLEDD